jgi:ADP-heptose:LPS heptosyltransferase
VLAHQGLRASHTWQLNEAERLLDGLRRVGLEGQHEGYGVVSSPDIEAAVTRKVSVIGLRPGQPFLVFCGGGKSLTQRWPLDRHGQVLAQVYRDLRVPVVGVGSPVEIDRYRREVMPIFPQLMLLKEDLSIRELFALFRFAAAYVGNDTGPMHVAAAMGCPVLAVMSARNAPGAWDPDVAPRLVVRHRTFCEDCFLHTCRAEGHRCMDAITVEDVINQALPFLRRLPQLSVAGRSPC